MTLRNLFDKFDRWSPQAFTDNDKLDIYNEVVNDINTEADLSYEKVSDDRLTTDSGTELTGTVTMTTDSTAVTGSGTAFSTELSVGEGLYLEDDGVDYVAYVASITSDTALTLVANYEGDGGSGTALTYRTKYPLSEITSNAGGTISVKRVIEIWDSSDNPVTYEVINQEIVFEDDPGSAEYKCRTVRFFTEADENDCDANATYTIPLPGNHYVILAGMKVKAEEDMFDQARPTTLMTYQRMLQKFKADYSGSRDKKPSLLEQKTFVTTEDGDEIEAI